MLHVPGHPFCDVAPWLIHGIPRTEIKTPGFRSFIVSRFRPDGDVEIVEIILNQSYVMIQEHAKVHRGVGSWVNIRLGVATQSTILLNHGDAGSVLAQSNGSIRASRGPTNHADIAGGDLGVVEIRWIDREGVS